MQEAVLVAEDFKVQIRCTEPDTDRESHFEFEAENHAAIRELVALRVPVRIVMADGRAGQARIKRLAESPDLRGMLLFSNDLLELQI